MLAWFSKGKRYHFNYGSQNEENPVSNNIVMSSELSCHQLKYAFNQIRNKVELEAKLSISVEVGW